MTEPQINSPPGLAPAQNQVAVMKVNRAFLLVLGTLLTVALVSLAVWPTRAADVTASTPAGPEDPRSADAATAEALRVEPHEVSSPAAAPERAAASAQAISPTRLRLRVVDDRDGKPLPGATVWCADDDAREDLFTRRLGEELEWFGDTFMTLRRQGRAFTADAAGALELPRRSNGMAAAGEHGELSGLTFLDGPPPPHGYELRLRALAPLTVQVFDHRGQPAAGVPLILVRQRSAQSATHHRLGRTDATGKLRAPTAGLAHGGGDQRGLLGVVGVGLGAHAVPCELDGKLRPPLRIDLPPTGSVEVVLKDAVGIPLTAREVSVSLPQSSDRDVKFSGVASPDRDGRARVDFIALDRSLRVSAWAPELICRDVAGPRREGEVVHVALGADPNACGLRGAIVADFGPVVDTPFLVALHLRYPDGKRTQVRGALRTDALGRFSLPLASHFLDAQGELRLRAAGSLRAPDARHTRALLAAPVQRGGNDFGTLALRAPVVCAAGVLVDEFDQPVTRASASFPDLDHDTRPLSPALQIDAAGRFALLGNDDLHPPHAELRAPGCLPQRIALGPQARDLRVVFARAHDLVVPVLVDPPGGGLGALRAELRSDRFDVPREAGLTREASGLVLAFADLPRGQGELRVWLGGEAAPLLATDVTIDGTSPPPALDLRGRLRQASVTVQREDGRPLPGAYLLLGEPVTIGGNPLWLAARTDAQGKARIGSVSGRVDALVVAYGMREQRWRGPLVDQTITLPRRELLAVDVPALAEFPAEPAIPAELRLEFVGRPAIAILADGLPTASWPPSHRTKVNLGKGSLSDAQLGEYSATLILTRRDGTVAQLAARGEPAVIAADTQRLTLHVDAAAIAAALR